MENSGSNRHKVEKIDENGNIYIKRLVPGSGYAGTADIKAWSIIIEIDKSKKLEEYEVILNKGYLK